MNKKILGIIILIVMLSVISFLGYQVVTKTQEKKAIANSIKTIPEFSFTTLDNTEFTKYNLKPNLPTLFLYFNSTCEFCQHKAQSISDSINAFKNAQLVFVSTESIEIIKNFAEQYMLNNKKNIFFLNDGNDTFSSIFNATSIPFILVYDNAQNLIKTHKGQLNSVGILKIINTQK